MSEFYRLTFKLSAFLLSLFLICGCSGGATSSSFGLPTGAGPDGLPGAQNGIAEASQFYVGVDSDVNSIAHVHDQAGFSTKCAISPTQSLQDISCIVDIPEAELYVNGLALKHNIPANMCRYLRRKPYWYYNKEVGVGPKNIVLTRALTDSVLQSYTCSVDGSAPSATCTGYPEVAINASAKTVKCVYDQSSSATGSNCCFGSYTLTVTDSNRDTSTGNTAVTTETTPNKWGGNISACIGGAARYNWSATSTGTGLPLPLIQKTKAGVTESYLLAAPIEKIDSSTTIDLANYYTPATHTHTGFGPALTPAIPARTSNLPYFIDPIDDRDGTKIPSQVFDPENFLVTAQDSYEYECLDEAFEVLHRIRVYVREWDTYQDYTNFVSSSGVTAIPDRGSGLEGATCTGITGPCNDFYDLDDFVNLILGGPYNTTLGAITNRNNYFPNVLYK